MFRHFAVILLALLLIPVGMRGQYDASFAHYWAMETSFNPAAVGKQSKINVTGAYNLGKQKGTKEQEEKIFETIARTCNISNAQHQILNEWANDSIRDDKEVLLTAVKVDGGALEFASNRLKDDKDVLLAAVSQAGWTGCYASDNLRNDKDVILTAVKNDGQVLYYASENLIDDKDVVLAAVTQKPRILKYASLRLRTDKDVAKAAVSKGKKKVIGYLAPELQKDEEILKLLEE